MYDYRRWTPEQRAAALDERIQRSYPWHSPPHIDAPDSWRLITAACSEHASIRGVSERLAWFERELLDNIYAQGVPCSAWVVLPNHYHLLVQIGNIRRFTSELGKLHGRTSYEMNQRDNTTGRKVWHRCQDRCMRSEAHYFTSLNYIHNNAVKHGYVEKWGEWPYSSFHWYLEDKGRQWLTDLWLAYPVLSYGEKWDL